MAQGNGLGMSRSATDFVALLVVHSAIIFFWSKMQVLAPDVSEQQLQREKKLPSEPNFLLFDV